MTLSDGRRRRKFGGRRVRRLLWNLRRVQHWGLALNLQNISMSLSVKQCNHLNLDRNINCLVVRSLVYSNLKVAIMFRG